MPQAIFETDPVLRDQHIKALTGIEPYYGDDKPRASRPYLSGWETFALIDGVQSGDSEATQKLIGNRLVWVYENFAQNEIVASRLDLELEDIMQIGCLAVIEGAKKVSLDSKTGASTQLKIKTELEAKKLILQTKLVPSVVDKAKQVSHNTRAVPFSLSGKDPVVTVDDKLLFAYLRRFNNANQGSIENVFYGSSEFQAVVIDEYLDALDSRTRDVVVRRFGIYDHDAETEECVADSYDIYRTRVQQIRNKGMKKLQKRDQELGYGALQSLLDDDQTNLGLF